MGTILGVALLAFIAMNVPIAFSMGLSSIVGLLLKGDIPLVIMPQKIFTGCDSFPLLAVPLLILAGALMDTGGISSASSIWPRPWWVTSEMGWEWFRLFPRSFSPVFPAPPQPIRQPSDRL